MAALRISTAVNLLTAGANMLLIYSGALGQVPMTAAMPLAVPAAEAPAVVAAPAEATRCRRASSPLAVKLERKITSAAIQLPTAFTVPGETMSMPVREVTLGGSGTRTSAVTIGGASALPFRHFEGSTGHRPVIAMEVFDTVSPKWPESLRTAYGDLLKDPAKMARYCVDELGAEVISVRLDGCHPDNGDKSAGGRLQRSAGRC